MDLPQKAKSVTGVQRAMGNRGVTKRNYGKPSMKERILLSATGADPISNFAARTEEKVKRGVKGVARKAADKLGISQPVRSAVSRVAKGIGVGTAALRLGAKVANPLFLPQMAVKKALGMGITLPGSKYIGPKNPMALGKPVNAADAAAYEHDVAYDNYIKSGHDPKDVYGKFSKADQALMDKADVTDPSGLAAWGGMKMKKMFLGRLNE